MSVVTLQEKATVNPGAVTGSFADDEVLAELGIWLSGVESFLATGHSFAGERTGEDTAKEFSLLHAVLNKCALLSARVLVAHTDLPRETPIAWNVAGDELRDLASILRDTLLLSKGLIHSNRLGVGEWKAWCSLLTHRFQSIPAFSKLIRLAEESGKKNLPGPLLDLVESDDRLSDEHSELALVLPQFGMILKWLRVVGKMLEADEPLKPALLIFARVNEQIFELTTYINNRLEHFPDEEAEIFGSLDAASYTASIELKKVYSHELAGLAMVRPSPSIYARMETAHSILADGFQQMLAGFARILDSNADIFLLFPNFQIKLEQSLVLRNRLSSLAKVVQAVEKNPTKNEADKMREGLAEFMTGPMRYLFYKDMETIERFIEEIMITELDKDLVPILHRFGAYLETLFGQVSLRAVLEKHPYEDLATATEA